MLLSNHKIKKSPKNFPRKKHIIHSEIKKELPFMDFSEFCIYSGSSNILIPFANASFLPVNLQSLLTKTNEGTFEIKNIYNPLSNLETSKGLDIMRQVSNDQETVIEKWLWNKYLFMKKNEDLQDFIQYRKAKGCIDNAFDEFFCRQQQEFKKSRYFALINKFF